MTLYEYMNQFQGDVDTFDDEYDAIVTVCHIADEDIEDEYDKFCVGIIKKVKVVSCKGNVIVNWSAFINANWDKFKDFTEKYWNHKYEDDDDEFVYQWINEIHLYMAGYVSDAMYGTLNKFLETLE